MPEGILFYFVQYHVCIQMILIRRRHSAVEARSSYLSIISDGMAQSHCVLPWHANIAMSYKTIPQHLQGVLLHGRCLLMFRTFHNLNNDSCVQLHTWLLTLEHVYEQEGMFGNFIVKLMW